MNLNELLDAIDSIELALRDEMENLTEEAKKTTDRFDDYTEDENGNRVGIL